MFGGLPPSCPCDGFSRNDGHFLPDLMSLHRSAIFLAELRSECAAGTHSGLDFGQYQAIYVALMQMKHCWATVPVFLHECIAK